MNLAGIDIPGKTVLAPLAGWSDCVYRNICRESGVGLVVTEMASSEGISRNQPKTVQLTQFEETERPIAVQIFGAKPDRIAQAVEILNKTKPDFIDLNIGCPARKVTRRGAGSALLKDLNQMKMVARAAKAASDIPVSAKIRSGWDEIVAVDAAQLLEAEGVAFLTLHARTQKEMYGGQANWDLIGVVKESVYIPVIGNGDVKTAKDAHEMMEKTGCDMVMVGRAAMGYPWIFKEIKEFLERGKEPEPVLFVEHVDMAIRHFNDALQYYGEKKAVHFMKKQLAAYVKGLPGATDCKRKCFSFHNFNDVLTTLMEYKNFLITQGR